MAPVEIEEFDELPEWMLQQLRDGTVKWRRITAAPLPPVEIDDDGPAAGDA